MGLHLTPRANRSPVGDRDWPPAPAQIWGAVRKQASCLGWASHSASLHSHTLAVLPTISLRMECSSHGKSWRSQRPFKELRDDDRRLVSQSSTGPAAPVSCTHRPWGRTNHSPKLEQHFPKARKIKQNQKRRAAVREEQAGEDVRDAAELPSSPCCSPELHPKV